MAKSACSQLARKARAREGAAFSFRQMGDTPTATVSATGAAANAGAADAECAICRERPAPEDRATVPGCGHSFCASCIVSWAAVRGACALCRAPFESLLVRRSLDGAPLACGATALEPVTLLRRAQWVSATTFEPDLDIFAPPPADIPPSPDASGTALQALTHAQTQAARDAAPYYQDERVEDELEDLFWAREAKEFWAREDAEYRQVSRRAYGNRPFGANGFMASGRSVARPPQVTRRQRAAAAAAAASSSSGAGPSGSTSGGGASSNAGGRRKKKVKKASRAGRARAEEARKAEQAPTASNSTTAGNVEQATEPELVGTNSVGRA